MTEQEVQEYNQLVREYNYLVRENEELARQIDYAITNMAIIAGNMGVVEKAVVADVKYLSSGVSVVDEDIDRLFREITELTEQYFLFKNLSTASKNLTQYNAEYYEKYQFYNELRRVTLGYIIGLDSYIITNESLRKKVEKNYLANTEYWLSYAIMAVMLWASDEREAANRALNKAITLDSKKTAVFFMLTNLRFGRKETAANWYMFYLDKTDVNNLGDEWQKLLQAYLCGALGEDPKLEKVAAEYYEKIFVQTESVNAYFVNEILNRSETFAQTYLHVTKTEFLNLKNYCKDYPEMKATLSNFEKFAAIAEYYDRVLSKEETTAQSNDERIENVLYDLINSYDEQEAAIVRQIKYNEAVMNAKGDEVAALQKYNEQYGDADKKKNSGEMLIKWAFSEDSVETDIIVRKFSIGYLSEHIVSGLRNYAEKVKRSVRDSFNVTIDGCSMVLREDNYQQCRKTVEDYYSKNRLKDTLKDKAFVIYLFICAASIFLIAFAGLLVHTKAFAVFLVLGLVAGIFGGFMVWRRYVDFGKVIKEKCRKALIALDNIYSEIRKWKQLIEANKASEEDMYNSVLKFKQ